MPTVLLLSFALSAAAPSANEPASRPSAEAGAQEQAREVPLSTTLAQAGALVAAGALGPGTAGGVLALAAVAVAFSSSNGLLFTPLLLVSIGLFAMVATPVGFVLTAAALAQVPLSRSVGAAVLAPVGGLAGGVAGGGLGLLMALVTVLIAFPEQQLQGDLATSVSMFGALAVVAFGAGIGAAVGGGVGGGLGAAGGYAAGMGVQVLWPRRQADDRAPQIGESE